jgi:hypothetical protein
MSKRLNREHKYQVWITSYPLDGNSEASKYDPGHQLIGMHENITQAVLQARDNQAYDPIITKIVAYQETVTDVTDMRDTDPDSKVKL